MWTVVFGPQSSRRFLIKSMHLEYRRVWFLGGMNGLGLVSRAGDWLDNPIDAPLQMLTEYLTEKKAREKMTKTVVPAPDFEAYNCWKFVGLRHAFVDKN